MQVDVTVRGAEQAARVCEKLSRRLVDGSPQFRGIVDMLLEAEHERFQGRGTRWRKLARATLRRTGDVARRPLILTGALMRSLTVPSAPGQVLRITPTTLTFGTRIFYAKFHQKGAGVPKRTVVGLTKQQRSHIVAAWAHLLMEDL